MNLVLALGFMAAGGVLVYSGFKDMTIKATIAAINGKRTGLGSTAAQRASKGSVNPKTTIPSSSEKTSHKQVVPVKK